MLGLLLIVAVATSALACFAAKSSGDADQGRTYGYLRVSTDRQALSPRSSATPSSGPPRTSAERSTTGSRTRHPEPRRLLE